MADLAVFTAGSQDYADAILEDVDPEGRISQKLYRHDCVRVGRDFVKDLSLVRSDPCRTVVVDDNPQFVGERKEVYKIRPFSHENPDEGALALCLKHIQDLHSRTFG